MADRSGRQVTADESGMRLDRWFKAHFPGLGFGQLQKLLRTGQVRVDGSRAKTNTRLASGQIVRLPPAISDAMGAAPGAAADPGDAGYLRSLILHEDDDLFVFDKPFGLAVQGGSGLTRHVDGMLEALRDRRGRKPRLVHRLDRDTSGVLVVARTRKAASILSASFRARSTRKIYWALVRGVPKPRQGRISTHLARDPGDEERMAVVRPGHEGADRALSLYSVVEQVSQKFAWLSLRPITGRTHQLRVHAAHIGHPIIGDGKYFDVENWDLPGGMQNRLHLMARRIVMPHPAGGELDVTAPLPPHMRQSWSLLGLDIEAYDPDWDLPE